MNAIDLVQTIMIILNIAVFAAAFLIGGYSLVVLINQLRSLR
jgi:hypothetical protein